tara:strand:+ start:11979 stop:12443 length:465 start_codon:yes stop_codon:yes gene_type:complete
MNNKKEHFIIRVGDGNNFKNSNYPCWGLKKGRGVKTMVSKIKRGDILWFMTSKKYGGKLIGMSEFKCYYDRDDEPLIPLYTYSNKEQNWQGDDNWSIQINYEYLYNTEKQNIEALVACSANILNYQTWKNRGLPDLYNHYDNFKYYAEPIKFNI